MVNDDGTTMNAGEEKLSYGYGGTGKASTDCKFTDYGQPFAADDVVTAYVVSSALFCFVGKSLVCEICA